MSSIVAWRLVLYPAAMRATDSRGVQQTAAGRAHATTGQCTAAARTSQHMYECKQAVWQSSPDQHCCVCGLQRCCCCAARCSRDAAHQCAVHAAGPEMSLQSATHESAFLHASSGCPLMCASDTNPSNAPAAGCASPRGPAGVLSC